MAAFRVYPLERMHASYMRLYAPVRGIVRAEPMLLAVRLGLFFAGARIGPELVRRRAAPLVVDVGVCLHRRAAAERGERPVDARQLQARASPQRRGGLVQRECAMELPWRSTRQVSHALRSPRQRAARPLA